MINETTRLVPLAAVQVLLKRSMRTNATAIWRDAADQAERFATAMEAGEFGEPNGPEAVRLLASNLRHLADLLDADYE